MQERIERINKIIGFLGISRNELAKSTGLASSNLSKMMSGEQVITDKTLQKITSTYPQFNFDWLKTGNGDMLNPTVTVSQSGSGNVQQNWRAGNNTTQTNNSEKLFTDFIEGLKSQNQITVEAMSQTKMSIMQTGHALEEISEQRKLIERLISIIEESEHKI